MFAVGSICLLLAATSASVQGSEEGETRQHLDEACAAEVVVKGFDSTIDGLFTMSDKWINNRGIYKNKGVCLSWNKQSNHWWFGDCKRVGESSGYGYMHEHARCPYDAATFKSAGGKKVEGVYIDTHHDLDCAQEFTLTGMGENMDGTYMMTNIWTNNRGVYKKDTNKKIPETKLSWEKIAILLGQSMDADEHCVSWNSQSKHWWITPCNIIGKNQGLAWLKENVRCPYDGTTWSKSGNTQKTSIIEPNALERIFRSKFCEKRKNIKFVNLRKYFSYLRMYQVMCETVKMKPKTSFSPVLIRGIDYLRSAATNMAGAKVKFGMITGDASRIKNDILSATKNFIAAKNMLMSNVDSNSKQLSYTISQTSKYAHRIRKTQTSLKVETNRLKYAKARYLKYQKIEKEARETYNLEKRRYGKAYSNYLNQKRKYEKSKRNCRNWGWLSFGVTCIIHLVKKGDFNKAAHLFNASKGRLSNATRLFRVQKARYIKSSRNVYYTKRTLSSNLRSLLSYQSRRKSLQTKQQQLTSLSVDLKTSTLKLESIVASVNSMTTVKNGARKVSVMMHILKAAIQTTINKIREGRTTLKIHSSSLSKLELSYAKLVQSIAKISKTSTWSLTF